MIISMDEVKTFNIIQHQFMIKEYEFMIKPPRKFEQKEFLQLDKWHLQLTQDLMVKD